MNENEKKISDAIDLRERENIMHFDGGLPLAQAEAAYPLNSCVVSEDKFDGGAMGKPRNYLYQVSGQPDRLIRLCCKDCVKDFTKDPSAYLKKLDAAVAAKSTDAKR
jgi:hypothetical protein